MVILELFFFFESFDLKFSFFSDMNPIIFIITFFLLLLLHGVLVSQNFRWSLLNNFFFGGEVDYDSKWLLFFLFKVHGSVEHVCFLLHLLKLFNFVFINIISFFFWLSFRNLFNCFILFFYLSLLRICFQMIFLNI
jgi:hypothetical protein